MKLVAKFMILIGFCLGTLGAAGFHSPSLSANGAKDDAVGRIETPENDFGEKPAADAAHREKHAIWLFLVGVGVLVGGGIITKMAKNSAGLAAEDQRSQGSALLDQLTTIEQSLQELHQRAANLPSKELHKAISDLSEGPIYDVTSEFEHWTQILGFERYSQVWTGVATGERLVNRAWSMETDGHGEEAIEELRFAREAFAEATGQLRKV